MRKSLTIIGIIILLSACSGFLSLPIQTAEDGNCTVHITLGDNIRTLLPVNFDISKISFTLTFSNDDTGSEITKNLNQSNQISVELPSGSWTLYVEGFISGAELSTAAANVSGTKTFTVSTSGSVTSVTVDLTLHNETLSQNGSGILRYSINIPGGAAGVIAVSNCLAPETIVQSDSFSAAYNNGDLNLPSGYYYVFVTVKYNNKEKLWRETAHIYDDTITIASLSYTAGDFQNSDIARITDFSVSLPAEYVYINDAAGTITLYLPKGTNVNALTPVISFDGIIISPVPGEPVNFNLPVAYTVYTESGEEKTYSAGVSNSFTDLQVLGNYLESRPANTASNPVPASVKVNLDSQWGNLLNVIGAAGRYVDLDLADSTGMANFDPGAELAGKTRVVSLTLPPTATGIRTGTSGNPAFNNFTNLKSISGANLTSIGSYAFNNCASLNTVNFPVLVSMGDNAFRGCTGLGAVSIPVTVNSVAITAFGGCTGLTVINVDAGNAAYSSSDGVLYKNAPVVSLILCPEGKTGIINIKAGTSDIGTSAFSGCSGITGVIIPVSIASAANSVFSGYTGFTATIDTNSAINWTDVFGNTAALTISFGSNVTGIGESAFSGCTGLAGVTIPNNVSSIGESAFSGCSSLAAAVLPSNIARIENNTFRNCTALGAISIPASVNSIGNYAFSGCTGLSSITLLNGPAGMSIGQNAFEGCKPPTLEIPAKVTSIGDNAFAGYTGLTVTINTNSDVLWPLVFGSTTALKVIYGPAVTTIGNAAFESFTELKSVTLSGSVTHINDAAFRWCTGLGSLVIPEGLIRIGHEAFRYCTGLESLELPETLTTIGYNAFYNCTMLTSVLIKSTMEENSSDGFSPVYPFMGDLEIMYFHETGGPGLYKTYETPVPVTAVWIKTQVYP